MNVVAEMLLSEPAPALIWAALILLTFPAVLLLGSFDGARLPGVARREIVAAFRKQAAAASHYPEEIQVAADRAAVGARRWRQVWEQAEEDVNTAYEVWLEADARLRTALSAAAWGRPWSVRTCEEYAARERFLHRAVAEAVDRGELPADALGLYQWDALLHPVEQELIIARTSVAWLRSRYEQAVATERTAWHDAELARRASHSLTAEALSVIAAAPAPVVRGFVAVPAARTIIGVKM